MDYSLQPSHWTRRAAPMRMLRAARHGLRRNAIVLIGTMLAGVSVLCTMLGIAMLISREQQPTGVFVTAPADQQLALYGLVGGLALSGLLLAVANHERRQALARLRVSIAQFRALAAQLNDGLVVIDNAGVITAASDRFSAMIGCAGNTLVGARAADLGLILAPVLLSPGRSQASECELRRASGEPLSARVVARALSPVDGTPSGILAVVADLTEQRRVEHARRQAEDRARQHLNQLAHVARVSAMGEMASAIAHEINQPLTAIASYAKACIRLLSTAPAPRYDVLDAMSKVAAEALRAGEVVRHIRAFLQAKEADMVPVDANRLVSEVIRLAQPEARQLGATLHTDLTAELPRVMGEPIQLEQVILNLVRNALEAMRDARSSRRMVTLRSAVADDAVVIVVQDTGPGIDAAHADRLFEPFFTTKADGLGIGLAISRSIITMHGGSLDATSEPGRGGMFTIRLPRSSIHAHRDD